jgi:predicted nuclease of predicted toxin-antitoxin system
MRILADENFPGDAVTALREQGHDVLWIRTDAPGISDHEVLTHAQAEARILITFDKDFGELAFRFGGERYHLVSHHDGFCGQHCAHCRCRVESTS